MLNFDFLEKSLGIAFPTHFGDNFPRLALLLEIMGKMCIAIFSFPRCDVINFEISFIFQIKPLFTLPKKSRQKFTKIETSL